MVGQILSSYLNDGGMFYIGRYISDSDLHPPPHTHFTSLPPSLHIYIYYTYLCIIHHTTCCGLIWIYFTLILGKYVKYILWHYMTTMIYKLITYFSYILMILLDRLYKMANYYINQPFCSDDFIRSYEIIRS